MKQRYADAKQANPLAFGAGEGITMEERVRATCTTAEALARKDVDLGQVLSP